MLNTESWYFQQQHFSQERCITLKRCLLMILASRSKSSKHLGIHDDGRGGSVHFTILELRFTICTFTIYILQILCCNLHFALYHLQILSCNFQFTVLQNTWKATVTIHSFQVKYAKKMRCWWEVFVEGRMYADGSRSSRGICICICICICKNGDRKYL